MRFAVASPEREIRTFPSIVEAMAYWYDAAQADQIVREATYEDIADCLVRGDESVYSIEMWTIGREGCIEGHWGHWDAMTKKGLS